MVINPLSARCGIYTLHYLRKRNHKWMKLKSYKERRS